MSEKTSDTSGQVVKIPLKDILVSSRFNCRGNEISPMDVAELMEDIRFQGLLQPVMIGNRLESVKEKALKDIFDPEEREAIKATKHLLIMGYRRYAAFKFLKRDAIPTLRHQGILNEVDALVLNLVENIQRVQLDILEEAFGILPLYEMGLTISSISKRVGKSNGWTQVRIAILELPENIQQEIKTGLFSQAEIKQLSSAYKALGSTACIQYMKKIKDARIRGVVKDVKPSKEKISEVPKTKTELLNMVGYIMGYLPAGIHSRALAWAAGTLPDDEFFDDLEEVAEDLDLPFLRPRLGDI